MPMTPLRSVRHGGGLLAGSSLVHNVTTRSYPIVLPGLLFTRRYLPSPVLPRTCPAVMKAERESSQRRGFHALLPPSLPPSVSLFHSRHWWTISVLGFGYYVSRPLPCTYRSSALLACAIFLTALNTALTEIPGRFPAR